MLYMLKKAILKFTCADQVGLLSTLSGFFAKHGCNLTEVHQHTDEIRRRFYCRVEFEFPLGGDEKNVVSQFTVVGKEMGGEWHFRKKEDLYKVALLVSKDGHCLADLLWRWKDGNLAFDLVGVISNHDDLRGEVEREGVPFVTLPIHPNTAQDNFQQVSAQLSNWNAETIVMARYMQILPPFICQKWKHQVINIHHSFLPSFAGGSAYLQAYKRGVKIIGATCHYATEALDQGPIIEQEVVRTSHNQDPAMLRKAGQECERLALFRGLKHHLEDRVFCEDGRTVILGG
jgi:formyltetrahydrofolate deformylase